jgi:hypothetical protein
MRLLTTIFALLLSSYSFSQSTETGTSSAHGTSTEGSSGVCQIIPPVLPNGLVGSPYGPIQFTSAFCVNPVTWSVSVGAPPAGLTFSSSGILSGTPTTAGSTSFTVTLTDNLGNRPIFQVGVNITTSAGGSPTPPDPALISWCTSIACTPSPSSVITVGDGFTSPCDPVGGCSYPTSQIGTALAAVGCGQTLQIQNVPIVLPNSTIRLTNACDNSHWITIERDVNDTTFPLEGQRVTPCYAGLPSSAIAGVPFYPCISPARHMPLLIKGSSTVIQFGSNTATDPGPSSYRFVGIQWGRLTNYDLDFGLFSLPNNVGCTAANTACMNHQPNHIIFDRNIMQGDAQRQTTRAIALGGLWVAPIDSYFYDIQLSYAGGGGDAQVFAGGFQKFITNVGEWKISNNFGSASTMGCLFCGAFVEPLSPTTGFDGIPHDIYLTQDWFYKNPLWNTQRGQAMNESITIEGVTYPPQGDQEFIVSPSAIQVQQGNTFALHNTALNDSGGGLDRMTDAASAGSVTVDGLACTYVSTSTVGTTPAGTTVNVTSVANLAINRSILISGAGASNSNYIGSVTNISGTTVTISPATSISVAAGTSVYDPVCIPGGDSTHGHILKNSSHNVGSSPYQMQNIISWSYIACSAVGTPFVDCLGATTPTSHTIIFNKVVTDGRVATLGNSRTLSSTATITVVTPTTATSSGPNTPGTGADGGGGSCSWASPNNISTGGSTTCSLSATQITNALNGTGFGFSIPSVATINGIQVVVQAKESNTSSGSSQDNSAKLMKAGSVVGSNLAVGTALATSGTTLTYGGSSNLWGTSWTPADINNSGFGFSWKAKGNNASDVPTVTSETITVFYTITGAIPQIAVSPSATDLQIQPSYPGAGTTDAFGNSRQFCYLFFETPNYTQGALTWSVDGTAGGSATAGTVQTGLTGLVTGEAVYCAGSSTGTHTISVTDGTAIGSQTISVSATSPIWAMDLKAFTSKNGWEEKCGSRGLFNNSIVENAWGSNGNGGGQPGSMFLNQPINQANQTLDGNGVTVGYGPEYNSDLLVDHIHGLSGGAGMVVAALSQSLGIHRIKYQHIFMEDLNCDRWGNGFLKCLFADTLQYSGSASNKVPVLSWTSPTTPLANDINFDHITAVGGTNAFPGTGSWISQANNNVQFQLGPFSFTNSIVLNPGSTTFANNNGDANDCNTATGAGATNTEARMFQGTGYTPAKPCNSTYSISRNALVDNTASSSVFTSLIWQPTDSDATLFRNYNAGVGGDYRVVAGGQYDAGGARDASDGSALGADIAGITANDTIVRQGGNNPMLITTASLPNATHGTAYSQALSVSNAIGAVTWTATGGTVPLGAQDILDYACAPFRATQHLTGATVKYCVLNANLMMWIKGSSGCPWDGEMFDGTAVYQWFTEGPTFSNCSGNKMYVNPVPLWKRYHKAGDDDVILTPGPNLYNTTESCGSDHLAQIDNLDIKGELTGPFTNQTFQTDCIAAGGTTLTCNVPDNTPYLTAQKFIKGTAGVYQTRERYTLALGYGQIIWDTSHLSGGSYVIDQTSINEDVVSGGNPTPNFACGIPSPPVLNGLPPGTVLTSAPPMTIVDSTGVIKGTPSTVGSSTFTVQAEDSIGHIAQRSFTLVVQ